MSEQENVELVKTAYIAFARGDIPAILKILAEDVEWTIPGPPEIIPYAGVRRGRDEVVKFFVALKATVEFEAFEPREFIAQHDAVVVLGRSHDRMRASKIEIENEWAAVVRLKRGKISSYRMYEDTAAFTAALTK